MVSAAVTYSFSIWEYLKSPLLEKYLFLRCYFQDPSATGSLFPSSKALTEKMAAFIPVASIRDKNLRILEVGAGTGVVTQAILNRIGKNDYLDVVELNSELCETLRKKFASYQNVTIHEKDILRYVAEPYDFVVSSVPHNQFDANFVENIFKKYMSLLKDTGKMVYFEYKYPKKLSRYLLRRFEVLQSIQKVKEDIGRKYQEKISNVWLNLPPAKVRLLTKV